MKETVDFSYLVGRAIEGDNSAFEELYRLTNKSAYHTASLLLKNPSDVEDVLQNVYLKVSLNLNELKNPEKFEGWVKTIVENESKNYIKKEKRINAPIVFLKNKNTEYSEEWNQPVPQEYMEREELRKSIGAVVDKLSPEIRACIVLFHYEDKSLNEISELLDLPLGTVKSRLHNGRKQIEKEFNKLRKKDPTLYGIAAIPALVSFMVFQAENITVPAAVTQAVLSATAAGTGTAAVSAAGAASAGGAAASAASTVSAASAASVASGTAATAATSIAVKVAAVAVAGSVAVGGTAAIKNHVENKAEKETTLVYSSTFPEETCTVAQTTLAAIITEALTTVTEESTSDKPQKTEETETVTVSHTAASTTMAHTATTKKQTTKPVTTKKETTAKSTTARVTTTLPTTTEKITTTKKETTTEEKTTQKPTTTRKPTTTAAPTTSPENNYGVSGGVITEYTGSEANVSIPQSVGGDKITAIGAGAFAGNTKIKSVSLPSGVTQIGQEAFADCTSLSSVSLPSSTKLIGIGAFYGCTALSSVSIPSGTETISDEAFAGCSALSTVTIPSSVTVIADDAFDGCNSLTIRCEENSAAHNYAVENSIEFVLI